MGHTVHAGQEEHYRPTDVEFHRKEYAEKAMPFLALETPTPTEASKIIETLKEQNKKQMEALKEENDELRERLQEMQEKIEVLYQVQYQQLVNQMTKSPDKIAEELKLTAEAYRRIRIEDPKTNKNPSQRYQELIEEIESKTGTPFPSIQVIYEEEILQKLQEEIRQNPEAYEITRITDPKKTTTVPQRIRPRTTHQLQRKNRKQTTSKIIIVIARGKCFKNTGRYLGQRRAEERSKKSDAKLKDIGKPSLKKP